MPPAQPLDVRAAEVEEDRCTIIKAYIRVAAFEQDATYSTLQSWNRLLLTGLPVTGYQRGRGSY